MQRRVHDSFSLEKLSEHHIYTIPDPSHFDCPWWKAKICWHSVDARSHDGAGNVALSLFPIKVSNTMSMNSNNQIASELPDLQDQKLLTLRWCSYSEWGREPVALSSAWKASQYHIYEWRQPITTQITNDARPKLVDAPLMLIFRMGQGVYGSLICLRSQPIPYLWMAATDRHSDFQWCKTQNHWHSVDAHIPNGAGSMWLFLLPKKPANTTFMNGRKQSPRRLPMMQEQKSLTLHWRWFCHGHIHNKLSCNSA